MSKNRKLALLNRMRDYRKLENDQRLLELHRTVGQHLLDQVSNWEGYDYGEGYFYQGFNRINISGFRDTNARFQVMWLRNPLQDCNVVDIGCNTGFVARRRPDSGVTTG